MLELLSKLLKKEEVENVELKSLDKKFEHRKTTYFIPVPSSDGRPYADKWQDKDYLKNVKNFGVNQVFQTEVIEGLKKLRDLRDECHTYDEMIYFSKEAIKLYKEFLSLPYRAEATIATLVNSENQEEDPSFEC